MRKVLDSVPLLLQAPQARMNLFGNHRAGCKE